MKKWDVQIQFTIQAKTWGQAWILSENLCQTKLRGLADVVRISTQPLSGKQAQETIAVNEPIGVAVIS